MTRKTFLESSLLLGTKPGRALLGSGVALAQSPANHQHGMEFMATALDLTDAQVAQIKEGMRQADAGLTIPGEDMDKWMASWGTAHELSPPKVQKRTRR